MPFYRRLLIVYKYLSPILDFRAFISEMYPEQCSVVSEMAHFVGLCMCVLFYFSTCRKMCDVNVLWTKLCCHRISSQCCSKPLVIVKLNCSLETWKLVWMSRVVLTGAASFEFFLASLRNLFLLFHSERSLMKFTIAKVFAYLWCHLSILNLLNFHDTMNFLSFYCQRQIFNSNCAYL